MAPLSLRRTTSVMILAAALSACATSPGGFMTTHETEVAAQPTPSGLDPIATAAFWGTRYDRDPSDAGVAVSFSKALRDVENNEEALRVMQQANSRSRDDADVLLELGKTLIANERAYEAVRPIERSLALGNYEDWSALSAYGVALDMTGQHRQARIQYERALALAPDKSKVLNNMGLSYALSGRHEKAEEALREATNDGQGTARIRQNFAIILAMSGKTSDAERLARSDLPPSVADGNVAYFRELVAGPAYWGDLAQSNVELPDFGDDPDTVSYAVHQSVVPEPNPSPTPGLIKKNQPSSNAPGVAPFTAPEVIDGKPAPGAGAKATDSDAVGASAKADEDQPTIVAQAATTGPEVLQYKDD